MKGGHGAGFVEACSSIPELRGGLPALRGCGHARRGTMHCRRLFFQFFYFSCTILSSHAAAERRKEERVRARLSLPRALSRPLSTPHTPSLRDRPIRLSLAGRAPLAPCAERRARPKKASCLLSAHLARSLFTMSRDDDLLVAKRHVRHHLAVAADDSHATASGDEGRRSRPRIVAYSDSSGDEGGVSVFFCLLHFSVRAPARAGAISHTPGGCQDG